MLFLYIHEDETKLFYLLIFQPSDVSVYICSFYDASCSVYLMIYTHSVLLLLICVGVQFLQCSADIVIQTDSFDENLKEVDTMFSSDTVGNNGLIQVLGVGEYCTNYRDGPLASNFYGSSSVLPSCYFCLNGNRMCPWNCNSGCLAVYQNVYRDGYGFHSISYCSAGCLHKSDCTSIPNGYFTGNGTIVGGPTSCPFECNVGYTKSVSSCVFQPVTCSLNQYVVNNVCTPCRTCTNGYWLDGCTGSNPGTCTLCNN